MSGKIKLQIGKTDGYRHLGAQPPLDPGQIGALVRAQRTDPTVPTDFRICEPGQGDRYSELSRYNHTLGQGKADERILAVANNVAEILREAGNTVLLDKELHSIGYGRDLFGGGE